MKNKKGLIISFVLILSGLIGALCFLLPNTSEEYRIVNRYVQAVEKCDAKKIQELLPLQELTSALDANFADLDFDVNDKAGLLETFLNSASLPEKVKSIDEVKLISVATGEHQALSFGGFNSAIEGRAFIKVDYTDEDGKEWEQTFEENFTLIRTQKGLKVVPTGL